MKREIILQDLENIYKRSIPWKQLNGKTVFITGAYGMLASYMIYMLIYLNEKYNAGIRIISVVRSAEKFRERFGEYADKEYMIMVTEPLEKEFDIEESVDIIIHAASYASPQYYGVCPVDVLKPNVIGSYYLLELAVRKKVQCYLQFSTGDVYGLVDGTDTIQENTCGIMNPLDIHSCYSESKRMAETMCYSYYFQYKVPVKILRIWHTYAPTMDIQKDPRVFASFVRDVINHKDIIMKSDGTSARSFCYIADAVAGYFTVLLKGEKGQAYNVCNTKEFYEIRKLAEIIASLRPELGLKVVTAMRKKEENYVENTVGSKVAPDDFKLRSLGWRPEFCVREGFERILKALE